MLNLFWFTALWFKVEDLYRWSVWDLDSSFMSTFLIDDWDFPLWPPRLYLKRDYKKSWLMAAFLTRFDLCIMWLLVVLNKEYKYFFHFIKSGMRYPDLLECDFEKLSSSIYHWRWIWENLQSIFVYDISATWRLHKVKFKIRIHIIC